MPWRGTRLRVRLPSRPGHPPPSAVHLVTPLDDTDGMEKKGVASIRLLDGGRRRQVLTLEQLRGEIEDRLQDVDTKKHVSVRWEPAPGICRVGVCVHDYTWAVRDQVIDRLLAFEDAHVGEVAVEFDVIPLEAVNTAGFAEV